ncbi:hypothetical protein FA15DRAFT_213712 [Coprinopsis marcescibilis]|uniref:Uncharacterized protein n=1 Tax=Coprinopsis marcescibilis TaxID=230819 RepID=A0A5C3KHF7_COPMA|nr:hypothetical protein FA15DRAFT_213712 [Coprinopsis marcescibilis]
MPSSPPCPENTRNQLRIEGALQLSHWFPLKHILNFFQRPQNLNLPSFSILRHGPSPCRTFDGLPTPLSFSSTGWAVVLCLFGA